MLSYITGLALLALAWLAEGFLQGCGGEIASLISSWIRRWWDLLFPSSSGISDSPQNLVGMDVRLRELKARLFRENVRNLGVRAMGGSGKTTLATALCSDSQVKERFGNKIIYCKVSDFSKTKDILESIWAGITKSTLKFQSIQDARKEIQKWLSSRQTQNILVVLDDIWLDDGHLRHLLFEANGYKTVVMSRDNVKGLDDTYELPLLEENDALSLFCYHAFDKKSIPERGYDKILVQQVAKACQGLPLALEVIGVSLHNEENEDEWKYALKKLSEGGSINKKYEDDVLKILALSIDRLDKIDNIIKQCFLDLILFPGMKEIHVDTLFDIWIYTHNLTLVEARTNLKRLEQRRLLRLVNHDIGDHHEISHGSACELYIVQHDILRNLAIYWVNNNPSKDTCKRLILDPLCSWERCENIEAAKIIAIRTDLKNENQWPKLKFPNALALILIFTGNECLLPTFLKTMPKLKVLIIINQNSFRTKLDGMSAFSSLKKLKSLRLIKMNVPILQNHCQSFKKSLRKLSLCLCSGDNAELNIEVCSELHNLEEISIDCCVNIKEFPVGICNLTSLKRLTITNYHELQKIPDNLGKLAASLEELTLYACATWRELPASICKLEKLELLDLSKCYHLERLPYQVGNLHNLRSLSIRECGKIKQLPQSASRLTSLRHLICDTQFENQCSSLLESNSNLKISGVEPEHHVRWLDR
ncbi:hypothetical protein SUGI_1180100 [Cryptomeria japonica]|uniref:probable disease resistance protein At4g33300 n=1 Tax=Cryptomeria japonica TaxID=3369 RepID=UPI0024149A69|nr:probable disease resistance protein At4g33300 [Cryptomeria japonica]GLJ54967.1 hypothetical protein SUGI_1180100 [Cryptomeria japonica]